MATQKSETAQVNFVEFAGDSLDMNFLYKSKNSTQPNDLTNFSGKLIIYDDTKAEVLSLTSSLNPTQIVLGNQLPKNILISVTKAQTATLGVGSFTFAFILTDTWGKDNTLIIGNITLQDRSVVPTKTTNYCL